MHVFDFASSNSVDIRSTVNDMLSEGGPIRITFTTNSGIFAVIVDEPVDVNDDGKIKVTLTRGMHSAFGQPLPSVSYDYDITIPATIMQGYEINPLQKITQVQFVDMTNDDMFI